MVEEKSLEGYIEYLIGTNLWGKFNALDQVLPKWAISVPGGLVWESKSSINNQSKF